MSDSERITNDTKLQRAVKRGSRTHWSSRESRRWRGVLLSYALKHHGHDYFIAEIDSLGRIV
jgi:hypothetical protein